MNKLGFFGDGPWAAKSLNLIMKKTSFKIDFICLRYSSPDMNLIKIAKKNKIKLIIEKDINSSKSFKKIKKYNSDLLVSMSYDQIFGKHILTNFKKKIINCHAGDLPFYRGRSILNWVLINDEKYFGITVHFVDKKIDNGDIILKKKFYINDSFDYRKLFDFASIQCSKILLKAIKLFFTKKYKPYKQSLISKKGSYFRKRKSGDEIIKWNKKSREIFTFIRGLSKPSVMASTFIKNKKIFINKSSPKFIKINTNKSAGTVLASNKKYFIVKTSDSNIKILEWFGSVKTGDKFNNYEKFK